MNKKINFVSQFAGAKQENMKAEYGEINDESAAKKFGVRINKEFSYWSWRACGIANIAMILSAENLLNKTLYELICEALLMDGYAFKNRRGGKDVGWKHDILCKMLENRGFSTWFGNFGISGLRKAYEEGKYVVASVRSKSGGHMVLITDLGSDTVSYNDPYVYKEHGGKVTESIQAFEEKFLNRGVVSWLR